MDARWTGQRFGSWADAVEAGKPVVLSYVALLSALVQAGLDRHLARLDQDVLYVITGPERVAVHGPDGSGSRRQVPTL